MDQDDVGGLELAWFFFEHHESSEALKVLKPIVDPARAGKPLWSGGRDPRLLWLYLQLQPRMSQSERAGVLAVWIGRGNRARETRQDVASLPDEAFFYYRLGNTWMEWPKDSRLAATCFEKADRLAPQNPAVILALENLSELNREAALTPP